MAAARGVVGRGGEEEVGMGEKQKKRVFLELEEKITTARWLKKTGCQTERICFVPSTSAAPSCSFVTPTSPLSCIPI